MGRRAESQMYVDRALVLEQLDDASWDRIERCLLHAIELDRGNLSALAELALFYQYARGDRAKAVQFAAACRARAAELIEQMNAIVETERAEFGRFVSRTSSGKI
jgi:hypothetical protein